MLCAGRRHGKKSAASCSKLFLKAELSSLMAQICVYTESPERKHSQIEILHFKLISCTNDKKKKKKGR